MQTRSEFTKEVFAELLKTRTQKELGNELGVDQSRVSAAKSEGKIGLSTLRKAAILAGRTPEEVVAVVWGEEVPPINPPSRVETADAVSSLMNVVHDVASRMAGVRRSDADVAASALATWVESNERLASLPIAAVGETLRSMAQARRHVETLLENDEMRRDLARILKRRDQEDAPASEPEMSPLDAALADFFSDLSTAIQKATAGGADPADLASKCGVDLETLEKLARFQWVDTSPTLRSTLSRVLGVPLPDALTE